jgi:quercetin dioxygenase-like cupin family protein
MTWLVSGRLRFEMQGEEIFLGPGDVLVIPPNVPHLVETLEDSVATDIFSPARADWISGDDAYLRK